MTNSFKKFNSIENSYREKFIEKIQFAGYTKEIFHVEEKVHGANFQFNVSGDDIVAGKRTGFITESEKFFNWKFVVEKHKEQVMNLKKNEYPDCDIIVFGELYGGSYPHPDVVRERQHGSVQKEIFYSPEQNFICFDILLFNMVDDGYIFINKSERDKLCEKYGIPYAKTLFTGTLAECLEYPNEFPTTISKELGLPDIEGNTCEGVVIRPENNLFVASGERAIIKNKNEKFTEKKNVVREVKVAEPIPEHIQAMVNNIDSYITENRLTAVMSKLGEPDPKQFGLYIKNFSQDVYEDFFKDYAKEFEEWEKGDKKKLQKQANMLIVNFLKKTLLPKI